MLNDLNVSYTFKGERPNPANTRVLIVCNHPLGGLDGIAMIHWVSSIYGPDVHFIVNDLLTAVKPLNDVFLPINKHGRQSRKATDVIEQCLAGDRPVIMFPAGMVSRRQKDGIRDLKWQKMFINKAIQSKRYHLQRLKGGHSAVLEAKAVKKIVYSLKDGLDPKHNTDDGRKNN